MDYKTINNRDFVTGLFDCDGVVQSLRISLELFIIIDDADLSRIKIETESDGGMPSHRPAAARVPKDHCSRSAVHS